MLEAVKNRFGVIIGGKNFRTYEDSYRQIVLKTGFPYSNTSLESRFRNIGTSIDINNVNQFYQEHEQTYWDLAKDFPNIAPPFPSFWLEYEMGKLRRIEGVFHKTPKPLRLRVGILATSNRYEEEDKVGNLETGFWETVLDVFMILPIASKHPFFVYSHILSIDGNGGIIQIGRNSCRQLEICPKEHKKFYKQLNPVQFVHPAWLAISFMHCKNVKMLPSPHNKPRRKIRNARNKYLGKRYYVLNIEPMKRVLEDEGGLKKTGLKRSLHICRGHFKDFRCGNGLYGKHKEIYWWGSHVRGTRERGEVVKDYKVKAQ
jgi:hypothetical protein